MASYCKLCQLASGKVIKKERLTPKLDKDGSESEAMKLHVEVHCKQLQFIFDDYVNYHETFSQCFPVQNTVTNLPEGGEKKTDKYK